MANYRKIYEKSCGIKIPKDYEIHHIDMNRENNDISNLVMLPKDLHQEYHKRLNQASDPTQLLFKVVGILEPGNMINNYIITYQHEKEREFVEIWYICQQYVDYRDYLLGKIPNIHNIKIGD